MGLLAILILVLIINSRESRPGEEPEKQATKEGKGTVPALTRTPSSRGEMAAKKEPATGEATAKQAKPEKPAPAPARPTAEPAKKAAGSAAGPVPKAAAPSGNGGGRGPTGDPAKDFGIPAVAEPATPEGQAPSGSPPGTMPGGTGEAPVPSKQE
jgi:cytoskeletal protein RodZ